MKIRLLLFALPLLTVLSCAGRNSPSGPSIDSTFVNFYADQMILQEEAKLTNIDSTVMASRLDSLHTLYKLTSQAVAKKTEEYQKDLSTWKQFHDQVVHRLEQLQHVQSPGKDRK